MTLDDIKHLFRFQTETTKDYTPTGTLNYILFDGRDAQPKTIAANQIDTLAYTLTEYVHEGYRDRTPLFIKPDPNLG
jgi:hypothetical protein